VPLDEPPGDAPENAVVTSPSGPRDGRFHPLAVYPAGPYGSQVGSVMANHAFLGWRDPVMSRYDQNRLEEVSLADFYDPRGDAVELIVVNASAVWCPVCKLEMREIDSLDLASSYRQSKVALVATLFEDRSREPAKPSDLALWGTGLGFSVEVPLVLDTGFELGPYFTDSATPLNIVIDARTMTILAEYMGYGGSLWSFVDRELRARGIPPPER
jgi:hypothetical protein